MSTQRRTIPILTLVLLALVAPSPRHDLGDGSAQQPEDPVRPRG